MFQLSLFRRRTAEKALELASWLRIEVGDLRNELKAKQVLLAKYEKNLNRLEGLLADLKQRELFDDEEKTSRRDT